ncbi:hypothetical protein BN2475_450022 [Paraburkholderia ribeironis]|uniref:Uncharacterized protein n=1 Tax=Paraburkholderia ribeironis TaxID=1247936 RepID=A0A1N7S8M9_9BURK|nr:hypothetical protein BN2475_450022 [Paraburkholderia ribeironis]
MGAPHRSIALGQALPSRPHTSPTEIQRLVLASFRHIHRIAKHADSAGKYAVAYCIIGSRRRLLLSEYREGLQIACRASNNQTAPTLAPTTLVHSMIHQAKVIFRERSHRNMSLVGAFVAA